MNRSYRALFHIFISSIMVALFFAVNVGAQNTEAEKIYQHLKENLLKSSYSDCVSQMNRAIALDNKTAVYFYQRGLCYSLNDETTKALADLDQAIKLNPSYISALYSRSHLYSTTDKQRAIADLKRVIEIDPGEKGAYDVLGNIYLDLGKYEEAFETASKLVELAPAGSIGFRIEAESLARRGRYDDAIPLYSESIKRADWDARARRERAEAYRKTGNTSAAEEDEKRAAVLEQSSGGMGYGIGRGDGKLVNPRANPTDSDKPYEPPAKVEPPQISKRPNVSYTEEARKEQVQGEVVLRVTFKADGTIGPIVVIKELPFGLTGQAIEAAKKIEFKPATRNGVPTAVTRNIVYTFHIY